MSDESRQLGLPKVEIAKTVHGLEMGVLSDGTSYLNGRSLARICGAAASTIINQSNRWMQGHRNNKLAHMLMEAGITGDIFIPTVENGAAIHAYPDHVCMVFLEYYAFESNSPNQQAMTNYRLLARAGLRAFVYNALGYSPTGVSTLWREFHDRLTLVSAPLGYFSVFKEIADFLIAALRGGLHINEQTVPDISVGMNWAKHWADSDLGSKYGPRQKFDHNYPEYFAQAASNPQPMWVYPVAALPDFRVWLQDAYVREKLPTYLQSKVKRGLLPASSAELLIAEVTAPQLTE